MIRNSGIALNLTLEEQAILENGLANSMVILRRKMNGIERGGISIKREVILLRILENRTMDICIKIKMPREEKKNTMDRQLSSSSKRYWSTERDNDTFNILIEFFHGGSISLLLEKSGSFCNSRYTKQQPHGSMVLQKVSWYIRFSPLCELLSIVNH